nr:uncharacterized protein LOC123287410 [Equus asinus]
MFPSAVTALTRAGRSRSPERAGRERARLGERESARGAGGERDRGAGGRALGGLSRERPGRECASPREENGERARARPERSLRQAQTEAIPCRAGLLVGRRRLGPALEAGEPLSEGTRGGLSVRSLSSQLSGAAGRPPAGAMGTGGSLESCVGGSSAGAVTARPPWAKKEASCPASSSRLFPRSARPAGGFPPLRCFGIPSPSLYLPDRLHKRSWEAAAQRLEWRNMISLFPAVP